MISAGILIATYMGHAYLSSVFLVLILAQIRELLNIGRDEERDKKAGISWLYYYFMFVFMYVTGPGLIIHKRLIDTIIASDRILYTILLG